MRLRMPLCSGLFFLTLTGPVSEASSPKWSYAEAYASGGDWYLGENNETATLAWAQSYVMMSLASMYRATNDPTWLDTLARHADAALDQRDDRRGVTDYRGVSAACWQNHSYQPANQPYCYVVHSGMIGYPIAEWVRLVERDGLRDEVAYDGQTFGEKADSYLAAVRETVAAHDEQWDPDGYYVFRSDASFMAYPGRDLPLNQSNAMGRLLVTLYEITGESPYREKAEALAARFADQITDGRWNYWGGPYSGVGEDVSHAAINVDFAALCAQSGLHFDDGDLRAFGDTFVDSVYLDDQTFSDFLGGGTTNGSGYLPQVGRWLRITPFRTGVYTAVRDLYGARFSPASATASTLVSWAQLAEFEPERCAHFFYSVDWSDPDPDTEDDQRTATAYGANILTTPSELTRGCIIPLDVEMDQRITTGQWDGSSYHRVATWQPVAGRRHLPYEPAWPFLYWEGGVLFQFADPAFNGSGVRVWESPGLQLPTLTSAPPSRAVTGTPWVHDATADGPGRLWWSLAAFPTGARIAHDTGRITWTPTEPGSASFTVRVENDDGATEQSFTISVEDPADTGSTDTGDTDTGGTDTGDTGDTGTTNDTGSDDTGAPVEDDRGCACHSIGGLPSGLALLPALLIPLRRRAQRRRAG